MKRILFTANTDRHILLCHMPYLKWFKDNKYVVDVATNTDTKIKYVDNKINLNMSRNPFSFRNIKAIIKLTNILKHNKYDLIHTHTPVGSVITRLACRYSHTNSKVIYTCHGFHFYKNAPLYYWLLFYPIEKHLMKYVDVLIVMNEEDYRFATKHFKNTDVRFINGVGFDDSRLNKKIEKKEIDSIYKNLKISKKSFIVTYVAEFSKRKRQLKFIRMLNKSNVRDTNIVFLLIGDDALDGKIGKYISKKKLDKFIKIIDFTTDIKKYLELSNVVISCSRQEGLPLNLMEAIYLKKIAIVSNCRGNVDLIKDGANGYICKNMNDIYNKILFVKENYKNILKKYKQTININDYKQENVLNKVAEMYEELL